MNGKKVHKVSGLLGGAREDEAVQTTIQPPAHLTLQPALPRTPASDAYGFDETEPQTVTTVALGLIDRSPRQNRLPASKARVEALAAEIARHGLNNPVILRPVAGGRYELVAGETRVAAYRMNGEEEIPAFIRPMGDGQAARRLVLDNFHHGDLSDYEIYKGLSVLKMTLEEEGRAGSLAEIAGMTPWEKTHVFRLMSFAKLPPAALELLEKTPSATLGAKAAAAMAQAAGGEAGILAEAVRAVLAGEVEQGRAAEWVAEAVAAKGPDSGTPAAGKADGAGRPPRSVRAVSVGGGRLACTVERTPRGYTVKAAKGVDLGGIEDELVEWLAGRLSKEG